MIPILKHLLISAQKAKNYSIKWDQRLRSGPHKLSCFAFYTCVLTSSVEKLAVLNRR